MNLISLTYFQLKGGFGWSGYLPQVQESPHLYIIPTHIEVENHRNISPGEIQIHNNHYLGTVPEFKVLAPGHSRVGVWRVRYKPIVNLGRRLIQDTV